jgi:glycosyltransferase involved in cell wall biosynthesis
MKKMRILLLAGLSSIHTIRWANVLVKQGHDVHLVSQQEAIDTLDSQVTLYKKSNLGSLGYFIMVPFVRRLIKELKPDVINAHYASGYGTTARLSGAPYMLSVWGSDVYKFPYRSKLHLRTVRKNLVSATLIASTSRAMAQQIKRVAPAVSEVLLTPFGVDTAIFIPAHKAPSQSIVIGTVKGLTPIYGIDILIRAFTAAKLRRPNILLKLKIVGVGPLKSELERLVKELDIVKETEFVGRVPHCEVPQQLRSFDIYAAFSRSESFGVAVLEASACGIPVVVSNVGGLPEVVLSNKTGFLVPTEDVKAATNALLELIDSEAQRKEMGINAVAFVNEHYSWSVCVDKFCKALEQQQRIQQLKKNKRGQAV